MEGPRCCQRQAGHEPRLIKIESLRGLTKVIYQDGSDRMFVTLEDSHVEISNRKRQIRFARGVERDEIIETARKLYKKGRLPSNRPSVLDNRYVHKNIRRIYE